MRVYLSFVEGSIDIEALQLLRSVKQCRGILDCSDLFAAEELNSFYGGKLCKGLGSSCINQR